MKKKWKYDSTGLALLCGIMLLAACKTKQEPVIPSNRIPFDLDGLILPVNQFVLSNVKAILPERRTISPVIHAVGMVAYNPNLINNISARYTGRIEKLYVKYNFEEVSSGQRIMDIYSPEILTEEVNLLFLLHSSAGKAIISASEQKLKLLGVTDQQLKNVESTGMPMNPLPLYCPYSGHIHDIGISGGTASMPPSSENNSMSSMNAGQTSEPANQLENIPSSQTSALSVKEGMYVQAKQAVFAVYNTLQVWAVLNVYPKDAALVKTGDSVYLVSETAPGRIIRAIVNYIDPVLDAASSTVKIRVYLKNVPQLQLRIGVLLTASIFPQGIQSWWLPKQAVIDLGYKKVVFVKRSNYFTAVPVQTGISADSLIEILQGLAPGDMVAYNAQYLVDSESFIKTTQTHE